MASLERKSTPEESREVEVDVDAILHHLKQAKDKELRLRAEKERVRRELEALRSGDLWSRQTATQRQLEVVRARKRELEGRESSEASRLQQMDEALREREVTVQKLQRQPPSAMTQAGSRIVSPANQGVVMEVKPAVSDGTTKAQRNETAAIAKPLSPQREHPPGEEVRINRRRGGNQEADAVDQLEFSIDLEKQQKRVQRLQAELEKSKSMRIRDTDSSWDHLSVSSLPIDESVQRRTHRTIPDASPRRGEKLNPNQNADIFNEKEPRHSQTTIRDQPSSVPILQSLPIGPQVDLIHSAASLPPQPAVYPPTTSAVYQPQPSLQYSSSPWLSMVPQMPWPGIMQPYSMVPQAMPTYAMVSPPVIPMFPPPGYAPQFVNPYLSSPASFGYPSPMQGLQPPPSLRNSQVERDVSQLEQQLDISRRQEQQTDDDKTFAKVQEFLSGLQHQVTQLAKSRSSETIAVGEETRETADPDLKSLKRHHLEAMLKVRNERDLLEEQDKLEETRERVEKRREERMREQHHEEWVTKQKRELMTLRLQRALTKLDASKSSASKASAPELLDSTQPYSPDAGVLVCWDFVSGLPVSTPKAQLTYAVYDGKIPRSTIKSVSSKACEAEGPSRVRALFATQRVVKPLPASPEVIVVVEVSSATQKNADDKPVVRRLGWTVIELFRVNELSREAQLVSGWLKARLRTTPMPDPSRVWLPDALARQVADDQDEIVVHFRVAHGEMETQVRDFVVDPDTHAGRYRQSSQLQPHGQPLSSPPKESRASVTTPTVASVKPVPISATTTTEAFSSGAIDSKSAAVPHTSNMSQDFLDLERLRLLSSSSATSRPTSGAVRPRSTLSAAPRNRLGAVKEDAFFDDASSSSPWIRRNRAAERRRSLPLRYFQPDDAFNVYIDGARFLPDNVAVTKVTVAALNADRSKISPYASQPSSQLALLTSDVCCPAYNLYVEYREKGFNPTLSLVIRIDTLDIRTKQPVILGYAVFAVFLDSESLQQPTRSNETQFILNDGAYQLPIYTNATLSDPLSAFSVANAVTALPKIPCATLLIRVRQAATSDDGLNVMSRADFQPHEWAAKGLDEPAPGYESGEFDSSGCVPSAMEVRMYQLRDSPKSGRLVSVQQRLEQLRVNEATVPGLLQTKPTAFFDLRSAFRYQPKLGFRVSIDGLHNIKVKAGAFCKVLYSVSPPAAFYQAIRLTNDVHFTATTDWSSLPTSPEFQDGFVSFRDAPVDRDLVLVIEVRAVSKNTKTGAWTSQPLAWSFLPVLDDKTESVAAGNFQLPLFMGDVKLAAMASPTGIGAVVEEIAAEKKKTQLPFMDGASVLVRLEDPQVPSTPGGSQPLMDAVASTMIPPKALSRFQYDAAKVALLKKKSPLSRLVPPGLNDKQLEKEINEAFAAELGIPRSAF